MRRKLNLSLPFKKKGNFIIDTSLFMIVMFIFSLMAIFGYLIFDEFNTDFQAESDVNQVAKDELNDLYVVYPSSLDGAVLMAFVLFWVMILVTSFFIQTHPVFFIVSILFLTFVIFVAATLSNTYEELADEADVSSFSDAFPMSGFLINNLPYAVLVVAFSVLAVLFGKDRLL